MTENFKEQQEQQVQGTSKGEIKIAEILLSHNIHFEQEVEMEGLIASSGRPLRFDFVVYDDDGDVMFAIEYQGIQHYQEVGHFRGKKGLSSQLYNDKKKREYCVMNNIPLIAVPYWDYDKISYSYIFEKFFSL